MDQTDFDVIVVGGGIAGCATTLSLMRSAPDATFALIDNANPARFKIGESLPGESRRFLHYLSPSIAERLDQNIAKGVHTRSRVNASVWQSRDLQETPASIDPSGESWHINRASFEEDLRAYVRSVCNNGSTTSSKLINANFKSVLRNSDGWTLVVRSESGEEHTLRAKWLIDASGRKATVAQKLGAKTVKADSLIAFYTVFSSTDVDPDYRTLVEATETGWWYSSQLSDQKRVVVFHTDDCDAPAKVARRLEGFMDLLHADTVHVSKIITDIDYRPMAGSNMSYPQCTAAGSSFLSPYGDKDSQWCAVGDAAIAFDPLSYQGMITALHMGCTVGIMLARQLSPSTELRESFNFDSIKNIFDTVRDDYEQKKQLHYARSIYDGEFWARRK
ncbi:geranylgeranyl reductase, partial [Rhizoctonia solani]